MSSYISPTACLIGPTGISAPSYATILAYLQNQYYGIFGADAYIQPDAQDGQLLAVFAQALSDANAATIAAYNSFSPATAQGAGLSSVVQINGLKRLVPTYSECTVTVVGQANITITNGQCIDPNQNIWALPTSVQIPSSGTIAVVATCQTAGAITLQANTLTINTPTFGWQSITNTTGVAGMPVEADAALRIRQGVSVALPSQTIFEGVVAAIEQIPGIGRVAGYENNTAVPLSVQGGGPITARSVCFVVENGTVYASSVFQSIFTKMTPGIPFYLDPAYPSSWNTQVTTDTNGSTRPVSFMSAIETVVNTNILITGLSGWSPSTTGPLIAAAVRAYYASLPIGGTVRYFSGIIPAIASIGALASTYDVTYVAFQVGSGSVVYADQILNYNVAATTSGYVTINGVYY